MPFLLTFWKPIAAILAMLAIVSFFAIAKHSYDERRRDEGRQEVQSRWDAAVAAQRVRELKAAQEADDFQRRADAKRELDFKQLLAARTSEIQARLASRHASVDLSRSLSDATRAANGQGTRKPAEADPTPATVPDELAVAEWFDQVASQYRACRERVDGWIKWDDERVTQ
jgi:hypothetical protein